MPSALRQYHDQRVLTPTLKEPIVDVSLYQKATARELSMKCTTLRVQRANFSLARTLL